MIDYAKEYHSCPLHEKYRLIDETGCSQCHHERDKASKAQEKKQANLAKRLKQGQIKKKSSKKLSTEQEIARLKLLRMETVKQCETCGYQYRSKKDIEYSHILPQGTYPEYAIHPLNAILECKPCHHTWTFGTAAQRREQRSFGKKYLLALQINREFAEKMTKDEVFNQLKQAS